MVAMNGDTNIAVTLLVYLVFIFTSSAASLPN
jgi:hypothetical protein